MDESLDQVYIDQLAANGLDIGSMNFTASGLISGFLFGVIGMWMFKAGRRNTNSHVLYVGVALMLYPYFTTGPLADWGVGIALCGLAYYWW